MKRRELLMLWFGGVLVGFGIGLCVHQIIDTAYAVRCAGLEIER